jgi:hypothetical protein
MDTEIDDIKRRAGILTEETFDAASHEALMKQVSDEHAFLMKLGQVIGKGMAPNNARQVLAVVGNRLNTLKQMNTKLQAASQKQHQKGQEKKFQDAEQAKAGGPRRPSSYGTA